jgi:hypothetical protein
MGYAELRKGNLVAHRPENLKLRATSRGNSRSLHSETRNLRAKINICRSGGRSGNYTKNDLNVWSLKHR